MVNSVFLIAVTVVAAAGLASCSIPPRLESAANSTVPATATFLGTRCDRPQTIFPASMRNRMPAQPVRTTLRFEVRPSGDVGVVEVTTSSKFKPLDDAAIDAIRKMKCAPMESASMPILLQTWYEFRSE